MYLMVVCSGVSRATLIACMFNICCRRKCGDFLFLNVVFAFVWLTFLVGMIGVPHLSHCGASVIVL